MFPDIDSFNLFFFPTLIAIVVSICKEERIENYLNRKRGKNNGIKHNQRA